MDHRLNPILRMLRTAAPPVADRRLLAAVVAGGDEAAFAEIVRRHGPMVLRVCRRVLGHREDAEDAFQATFVVLLRRAGRIGKPDALGSWLHGVAVRVSRELLALRQRRQRAEAAHVGPAAVEPPCPLEHAELAALLDAEVAGLPPRYRAAVVLCALQGRSRKDAARALGVPEGTLSSRLAKAKELLVERLAGKGVAPAALGALLAEEAAAAGMPAALAARTVRVLVGASLGGAAAGALPAAVNQVANGVVKAMIVSKVKGLAVTIGPLLLGAGVLFGLVGSGMWPSAGPAPLTPAVAAAPAQPMGENRIWVWYHETSKLVALDLDGRPQREVALKDGWLFRGISPAQNKLWFAGKDGRLPEQPDLERLRRGLWPEDTTLHVREINDKAEGTDLGIKVTSNYIVYRDGQTVISMVRQQGGFENTLIDVATKRVTKLVLPGNHHVRGIAPDGTWVLSFEYGPPYRLHKTAVAGGEPRLLSGTRSALFGGVISPDGTRVLMFAHDMPGEGQTVPDVSVYVIDVATAAATRIAGHDKQLWSVGVWSPNGRRIAYAWRARKDDGKPGTASGVPPTRLVVCDADGANARTILTADEHFVPLAWW
jgi:RNA polymerase sigma factor (sigma-70 family)